MFQGSTNRSANYNLQSHTSDFYSHSLNRQNSNNYNDLKKIEVSMAWCYKGEEYMLNDPMIYAATFIPLPMISQQQHEVVINGDKAMAKTKSDYEDKQTANEYVPSL